MDWPVHVLAAAALAEVMRRLELSRHAFESTAVLLLDSVATTAAHSRALCCSALQPAGRAGGDAVGNYMLVIPMPTFSRRAGVMKETLCALVARAAADAGFAPAALASTACCCGLQWQTTCGCKWQLQQTAVEATRATTSLFALYAPRPPAEPPPDVAARVLDV